MTEKLNEPCLVQTVQGFSVSYKNKLLYSKYNPKRSILEIIQKTEILSGTIILCFSPVLSYGIEELSQKLAKDSLIFGLEADPLLYNLAKETAEKLDKAKTLHYTLLKPGELFTLPEKIFSLCKNGTFRRVIALECSGGYSFNADFYSRLFNAARDSVSQFWKNRVTLIKFGKKYCINIFKNINLISSSDYTIEEIKVFKPIIVIGAGESASETLKTIKEKRDNFFLITVDAALKTLKSLNIKTDAAICEESQAVITKAFTGCSSLFDFLFLSTTVNSSVAKINPQKNIFYTPIFSDVAFLKSLKANDIIDYTEEPLGSVGLSATEIALKIRANTSVPVFVTGLDFSFSCGKTHATSSFHDSTKRCFSTKINGIENFSSSFSGDSKKVKGINNKTVITTTPLFNYAELFKFRFSNKINLFDARNFGVSLGIPHKEPLSDDIIKIENKVFIQKIECSKKQTRITKTKEWLLNEKNALNEIKDIFIGKTQFTSEKEKMQKLSDLITPREYLYLHFPDGYKVDFSQSFLNRIRIELDYFLKIINLDFESFANK